MFSGLESELENLNLGIVTRESKADLFETFKSHYAVTLQTFLVIILMVILVAGFGLSANMNAQIGEQLKEFAIMKSFGASKKQIRQIVVSQSIYL